MKRNTSQRIQDLRELVVGTKPEICPERALIVTQAYRELGNNPAGILRAKALEKILSEMSIYIVPGELLVGNHSSKLRAAPVFPEFEVSFLEKEMTEFNRRSGDPFDIDESSREKLAQIIPFWKGRTIKELNMAMWPEENKLAGQNYVGVIDNEWNLENSDGHLAVDYPKLINFGLGSIIHDAEEKLSFLDIANPDDLKKKYFYESVVIATRAVIHFAHRSAELARKEAEKENNVVRKMELERIAEICSRVPENPARTFYEALQSIWFVQLAIQIDANGHSVTIGRFDQFMYPFYQKDIQSGIFTDDQIYELMQMFWIKLSSLTKLRCWSQTRLNAGYPMFQNLTIGGQTPDGDDACNELTYLCLDVTESLKLFQPTFTARVHHRSPREYLHRCVELIKQGLGMPSLFNDEVIIPALINRGVNIEDARSYCMVGCVEPSVQGKWGGRYGACLFNLPKCLELALNNGKDPRTGIQLCPGDGDLATFTSFEDVFQAYEKQVKYFVRQHVIRDNIQDMIWERYLPIPLISCLVSDCMERGKEIKEGGAIYDYTGGQTGGIANVANSLAAIKKLVFEESELTGADLKKYLDTNFKGMEGEKVRQILINKVPKYGNDDEYVDSIARRAFSVLLKEVSKYHNTRFGRGPIGGSFHHATASTAANVPFGMIISAMPDGRKAFSPLADTESPTHFTDLNGPTAVVLSASKLEHIYESGGAILNLKFSPIVFENDENLEKLIDLIRTYFDMDGMELQINVISAQKLRDAQNNPEKYKDLLIRVAGYSAYFVDLDLLIQNDIIERTENLLV
ncbi:MAG: glycyl radical protein [Atribacterota bacterium]